MRAGMDERTGRLVTGFDHVAQTMRRALTTRRASLVLRRRIGSALKDLQDQNMVPETILAAYIAIVEALSPDNLNWGEPGFRLREISLVQLTAQGGAGFILSGDYYPNGHLGDYTLKETVSTTIPTRELAA